jgi:hypothetical protein
MARSAKLKLFALRMILPGIDKSPLIDTCKIQSSRLKYASVLREIIAGGK